MNLKESFEILDKLSVRLLLMFCMAIICFVVSCIWVNVMHEIFFTPLTRGVPTLFLLAMPVICYVALQIGLDAWIYGLMSKSIEIMNKGHSKQETARKDLLNRIGILKSRIRNIVDDIDVNGLELGLIDLENIMMKKVHYSVDHANNVKKDILKTRREWFNRPSHQYILWLLMRFLVYSLVVGYSILCNLGWVWAAAIILLTASISHLKVLKDIIQMFYLNFREDRTFMGIGRQILRSETTIECYLSQLSALQRVSER